MDSRTIPKITWCARVFIRVVVDDGEMIIIIIFASAKMKDYLNT